MNNREQMSNQVSEKKVDETKTIHLWEMKGDGFIGGNKQKKWKSFDEFRKNFDTDNVVAYDWASNADLTEEIVLDISMELKTNIDDHDLLVLMDEYGVRHDILVKRTEEEKIKEFLKEAIRNVPE